MTAISDRDLKDIIVILNEVKYMQRRPPVTGEERRVYNTLSKARRIASRMQRKLAAAGAA